MELGLGKAPGGSCSGAKGTGREVWSFLGNVHKGPFRLREWRDPRRRTPLTPSPALPGAHSLASWELTLSALPGSLAPHLPLPPDPLRWGMLFLGSRLSSSLSRSLILYLPTPATSQTRSWALPYYCFVSSSPSLRKLINCKGPTSSGSIIIVIISFTPLASLHAPSIALNTSHTHSFLGLKALS